VLTILIKPVLNYSEHFGKDRAVVFRGLSLNSTLFPPFGGSLEHQLLLTATAPEELKKVGVYSMAYNKHLIEHCSKKKVIIAMIGDDYGDSHGCMISPDSFRQIHLPILKQISACTRENGLIPFFHCCGRIWDILDDFIDAGFAGYQSIQGTAGMNLEMVKKKYGRRLTLWAGVQCETLIEGTLQEVEDEVLKSLQIGMPCGGFIFGSTNSVQFGAKTQNYLKALETVRKHGVYS
jgi:uroporphyrinogen decarboxylase